MKSIINLLQKAKNSGLISRILQILLVVLLMIATIYLSGPLPQKDARGRIITLQPTATSISGEQSSAIFEKTPTTGVVVAGLGVVLIILVGTAIAIRRQK